MLPVKIVPSQLPELIYCKLRIDIEDHPPKVEYDIANRVKRHFKLCNEQRYWFYGYIMVMRFMLSENSYSRWIIF